ncbi:hypothetical protein IFR05_017399, partial [Cadophora sp. M221]
TYYAAYPPHFATQILTEAHEKEYCTGLILITFEFPLVTMSGAQPRTVAISDSEKLSNFIYLRTFPGSQDLWYAYVTCSPSERGLQKIVEKGHNYSGSPSPGYYIANKLLFTENNTPSFFHNPPQEKGYNRVPNTEYLLPKYIIQWARDDRVDVQALDLAGGSPEGVAELGILKTNEDQDGFQRAFTFSPWEACGKWPGTTPFYSTYVSP